MVGHLSYQLYKKCHLKQAGFHGSPHLLGAISGDKNCGKQGKNEKTPSKFFVMLYLKFIFSNLMAKAF